MKTLFAVLFLVFLCVCPSFGQDVTPKDTLKLSIEQTIIILKSERDQLILQLGRIEGKIFVLQSIVGDSIKVDEKRLNSNIFLK